MYIEWVSLKDFADKQANIPLTLVSAMVNPENINHQIPYLGYGLDIIREGLPFRWRISFESAKVLMRRIENLPEITINLIRKMQQEILTTRQKVVKKRPNLAPYLGMVMTCICRVEKFGMHDDYQIATCVQTVRDFITGEMLTDHAWIRKDFREFNIHQGAFIIAEFIPERYEQTQTVDNKWDIKYMDYALKLNKIIQPISKSEVKSWIERLRNAID